MSYRLILISMCFFVFIASSAAQDGTWSTISSMPEARTAVNNATAQVGGAVYVAGGLDGSGAVATSLLRYDPATDTWEELPDMPEPTWNAIAVEYDGKLYVFGGFRATTGTLLPSSRNRIYDPFADEWTDGATMPVPRGGAGVAVVGDLIHVVGGLGPTSPTNQHLEYDPVADRWFSGEPMPTARDGLAVTSLNGKLYAIGGNEPSGTFARPLTAVEVFEPVAGTWTSAASLPVARDGLEAVTYNGQLYVFGGSTSGSVATRSLRYDPDLDTWHEIEDMPDSRTYVGAAVVDSDIFVLGGGSSIVLSSASTVATARKFSVSLSVATEVIEQPGSFRIASIYPNPLRRDRASDLVLEMSVPGEVTLRVSDVSGRIVETKNLGMHAAGQHTIVLDILSRLSAGTYLVNVESGGRRINKLVAVL